VMIIGKLSQIWWSLVLAGECDRPLNVTAMHLSQLGTSREALKEC
jgi:hypothetical protein